MSCHRTSVSSQQRISEAALALLSLLGGVAVTGCVLPKPRLEPPQHVLLITVDTLRADHMSLYGYSRQTSPGLDRWATEAVVFDHAIAQWPKTGPSFASLFTGLYPQTSGLTHKAALTLPETYFTLAELFQSSGYKTLAVVSNPVLPARLGWSQGFDEYHETWAAAPELEDDSRDFRRWTAAPRVNEIALPLLQRYAGEDRLFIWLHYTDPHTPYILPENFTNPFLGDADYTGDRLVKLKEMVSPRVTALGEHRELRYYVAQYDANILVADQHIAQALDLAASLGLLEEALVILTADHGESLGEHDYFFGHGRLPYNASARVPLVFLGRGLTSGGGRVELPVELVDLFPTLQELVAPLEEVPQRDGKSLVPLLRGTDLTAGEIRQTFRYAFSQAGRSNPPKTHFRSVQDRGWKLIYHPAVQRQGEPRSEVFELYHLETDPLETRNLLDAHPHEARRLQERLFEWMKGADWIERPHQGIEDDSEATRRALRALGYL